MDCCSWLAPGEERRQPPFLLLVGTEKRQQLHAPGVGGRAVEYLRRDQGTTADLSQRRVVQVAEAFAPVRLVRQEQVPQSAVSGRLLEFFQHGRLIVRPAGLPHLRLVDGLEGSREPGGLRTEGEIHDDPPPAR
jgi:hypothetical protein